MQQNKKEIERETKRRYCRDNKELINKRDTLSKRDRKAYFDAIRLELGCQVCGYNRCVNSLVFHHKDESLKTAKPHHMHRHKWSYARIDEELTNCMVLCANCHQEHHAQFIDAHEFEKTVIVKSKTFFEWDKSKTFTAKDLGLTLKSQQDKHP